MADQLEVKEVRLELLHQAEWNPRTIAAAAFEKLCASILADPQFLWLRPVLAMADGTIYAGNMRYAAAQHLGLKVIPAVMEDVEPHIAKERAVRDNYQWGVWAEDELGQLLAELGSDGNVLEWVDDFQPAPEPPVIIERGPRVAGTPTSSYSIVFETAEQRVKWTTWLRDLKRRYPEEGTVASRIDRWIDGQT